MKRFALFALPLGVLVAGIVSQPGAAQGQGKNDVLSLSLVGIAVSDYAKSQAFYERVMTASELWGAPVTSASTVAAARYSPVLPPFSTNVSRSIASIDPLRMR